MVHRDVCNDTTFALSSNHFSQARSKGTGILCNLRLVAPRPREVPLILQTGLAGQTDAQGVKT